MAVAMQLVSLNLLFHVSVIVELWSRSLASTGIRVQISGLIRVRNCGRLPDRSQNVVGGCRENRPVTACEMLINLLKSPIL